MAALDQSARRAPNIVLILLDDTGFGDSSTFGGPAKTPELDKLAAQGLRYNRFDVSAIGGTTEGRSLGHRVRVMSSARKIPRAWTYSYASPESI